MTKRFWIGAGLVLLIGCGDEQAAVGGAGTLASTPPVGAAQAGTSAASTAADSGSSASSAGTGGDAIVDAGLGVTIPVDEPLSDKTEFVSADTQATSTSSTGPTYNAGEASGLGAAGGVASAPVTPATDASASGTPPRAVERGDIYRVLADQRILNLNSYRGVQILDVSDPSKPRVEGRLPIAGQPVELYVVGDRAIVLLNNWQGYYGARDAIAVESVQGGLVLTVDIHDRAHPALIDQATVPGSISTSRLTQGGGRAALYVAASLYEGQAKTVVKSFDVTGDEILPKSELDLGGYVQDIQATTDLLMVASNDWQKDQGRSKVSLVDISSPDGAMVRGGDVLVQGLVQNKFNMDAYKGILRVVSGSSWSGAPTNHVETFSLANLQAPKAIADCTLGRRDLLTGQGEQLYATLFMDNRAFFVTYYRTDPFHAFSIDDAGQCQEHNEFIVSGWNDFLTGTLGGTRLIGIGHNDQNNTRKLAVSLYDATNLANRVPLEARAEIDLNGAYSEGSWDDRGFSVLEDAVSVSAADGTVEKGLVLLPYQGWDASTQTSVAQIQIFTFSDHTLTKRGSMDHGSAVRRSFQVEADTTANLSEEQLSLFDTQNPDAPSELGRVDVAPNYSHVFVYGDYVVRVRTPNTTTYYPLAASSTNQTKAPEPSVVQVLRNSADVDGTEVLAQFDIPANGSLSQVGNLLVSVFTQATYPNATDKEPTYDSEIQVFDLTDPEHPRPRGTLSTDRIEPNGYFYGGGPYPIGVAVAPVADCFDCGSIRPYTPSPQSYVLGAAIAFQSTKSQQKSLGRATQCYSYPTQRECTWDNTGTQTCSDDSYYSGGTTCTTPEGGQKTCTGQFYLCDKNNDCKPVDEPDNTNRSCNDFEQFRYWSTYSFDTLDLRNPDSLTIAPRVTLPEDEEDTSVIAVGRTLYVNHQKPFTQPGDARPFVKHYVRLLDFSDPTAPARGAAINIPGDAIAADGDTVYARDYVWKDQDNTGRTLVSRLTLSGNLAHQQASHLFEDRQVSAVDLDGAGHVLVSTNPVYDYNAVPLPVSTAASPGSSGTSASPVQQPEPTGELTILDAVSLDTVGSAPVDSWATFKDARRGRALFQVSGGLLVFDVRDAAHPKAQAYFATSGWPSDILFDGDTILFAAGMYGVYRFDANVFNLLSK